MRKTVSIILTTLFFCLSAQAIPFEQLLYKGRAVPFYNDSNNPEQQKYIERVRGAQLAERMAALVNGSLMIKSDIGVGIESCSQRNAFFSPQSRAIVICSEFIELMLITAHNDKDFMMTLPEEQFVKGMDGVIWGIFFHELAHAIIYTNKVAVPGREEDVADQFAVWYAVNFLDKDTPVVMPTIWFWGRMAKARDITAMSEQARRSFMSNEHSLDEQRVYNLACLALGTGTEGGRKTAKFAGLPNERAQRCPGEYAQVEMGIKSLFKKYFKVRPLRG